MDNAFKFTKGGHIQLHTYIENTHAIVSLIDTGIGIPKIQLNDIFEPFEQLNTGSTRVFEGLGLGLTFAIKYIEGIGGKLNVQSIIGKGITFTLALPLQR